MEIDNIYNMDCLEGMKQIPDGTIDCVVTDIPYGVVNRDSNGLRNLDKDAADIETFNLSELTATLCRKSKGSVYMFCLVVHAGHAQCLPGIVVSSPGSSDGDVVEDVACEESAVFGGMVPDGSQLSGFKGNKVI